MTRTTFTLLMFLCLVQQSVIYGADPAVKMQVEMAPKILHGDPLNVRVILHNSSDVDIETKRPFSVDDELHGFDMQLKRDGEKALKKSHCWLGAGRREILRKGEKWVIDLSLADYYKILGKTVEVARDTDSGKKQYVQRDTIGKYELLLQHQASNAEGKARFEIVRPEKEPIIALTQKSEPLGGGEKERKEDSHFLSLRASSTGTEILYSNDLPRFPGYILVDKVAGDVKLHAVAVRQVLDQPCRYDFDGRARPLNANELKELNEYEEDMKGPQRPLDPTKLPKGLHRGGFQGTDYQITMNCLLMKRRPKYIDAIVVVWLNDGRLRTWTVGKYRPILSEWPGMGRKDDPPINLRELPNKLSQYDILSPARTIETSKPVKSIVKVETRDGLIDVHYEIEGETQPLKMSFKAVTPGEG